MKKMVDSLKYIKLYDIFSVFIFLVMIIPSLLFRLFNRIRGRKILLITEDGKSARDNGYHFYKYIRTEHPNDYCFYVIDKNGNDYNKVKEFGNIIQYRSLKHWLFYMSAYYNISNHKHGNPDAPLFYLLHVVLGLYNNRVFLQHGITINNGVWLHYKNTKFRYIICGAKDEYNYIKNSFGYPDNNVIYTGFARFDNLYNNNVDKKQILIMPTWRNWLGRETNSLGEQVDFKKTPYYINWNNLLNDSKFLNYIEKENIKVLFYPHINMQKYLNLFDRKSNNIEFVNTNTDIQKVLKESSIMITDYSSVFMDFAYMNKPVIFYQFDYKDFREKQYAEGYYDYNNGFGPVCFTDNDVITTLKEIMNNGLNKKYYKRMSDFFEKKDKSNCERIYHVLNQGV